MNSGNPFGHATSTAEINVTDYRVMFGFTNSPQRIDPHVHVQHSFPRADLARVAELVRPKYIGLQNLAVGEGSNEQRERGKQR